jgi:hypothetical protein
MNRLKGFPDRIFRREDIEVEVVQVVADHGYYNVQGSMFDVSRALKDANVPGVRFILGTSPCANLANTFTIETLINHLKEKGVI